MNYLSAIFHSDLERQSRKLSKASVYPQDALPSLHGTMAKVVNLLFCRSVIASLLCYGCTPLSEKLVGELEGKSSLQKVI